MRGLRPLAVGILCTAALGAVPVRAQERPFPAGESSHEIEGLRWSIVTPEEFDATKQRSLVVILHGAGGTETGMARSLAHLAKDEYVIVAPKSKGQVWEPDDLVAVRTVVAALKTQLNIGERRLHGAGFSNGGWNLEHVAFDEDLTFTSACWIAAGHRGRAAPKHAKKGMGVIALAGAEDANCNAAEQTPVRLGDDVRSAEVRIQPNLGHEWPGDLMPYYGWWLGVQEGRFVPGETLAFAWTESETSPPPPADDGKSGSFEYWYAESDAESAEAKALQNQILQDASVRFFGGQLRATKRARSGDEERFAELKLKSTPAIVVYDTKGKPKKVVVGKFKAKTVAAALRSVAATKKIPK